MVLVLLRYYVHFGLGISGTEEDAEDGAERRSLQTTRQDHRGRDHRVL